MGVGRRRGERGRRSCESTVREVPVDPHTSYGTDPSGVWRDSGGTTDRRFNQG